MKKRPARERLWHQTACGAPNYALGKTPHFVPGDQVKFITKDGTMHYAQVLTPRSLAGEYALCYNGHELTLHEIFLSWTDEILKGPENGGPARSG